MHVEFRVLGPLEVLVDGRAVPVPAGRARVLLATLLLRANRFVSVDELIDRLWEGEPPNPDRAKTTLQMVVTRLRQALGDANCVRTMTGGYTADVSHLDLSRFRQLVAASDLTSALDLWRGPMLANVESDSLHRDDVPPLLEERLVVLGRRITADLDRGLAGDLVPELRSLIREHPLREGFWAQLMLALYRSGQQAEALAAYQTVRVRVADELGVDPSQELLELHQRMLNSDPALAKPSAVSGPRQLPFGTSYFVGRDDELRALMGLVDLAEPGRAVVISAIDGTAGIGKTALAVHWAHRVADRFPDGQLYVNLRGFDRSGEPVDPAQVIRAFLDAFDIPRGRVPVEPEAQAALYRSILAERRVLVLLDNARDIEQVRPLLPGGGNCLVVITSRSRLTGLVVQEGALPVTLDVLTSSDAVALMTRRLGANRVEAESDAVAELIDFCDGLPLALAVVAARVATDPRLSLRAMAGELADERSRLGALDTGDPVTSAQAVFSWSYQRLNQEAARVFRLLGVATGPDISLQAAAALTGVDVSVALAELTRLHLLTERAPGRFAFHDLVRAYARGLSEVEDDEQVRIDAARRLLDFYLHTTDVADRLIRKSRTELPLPSASAGVRPLVLGEREAALAWCDSEYANLLAAARMAVERGLFDHAWQLPTAMWGYLHIRQSPRDRMKIAETTLSAARAAGDRFGEAVTLHTMANGMGWFGRHDDAVRLYEQALRIREEIGHEHGIAVTLDQLAVSHGRGKRFAEAQALHRRAIECRRAQGDLAGLATALNNYAMTLAQTEEYDAAVEACTESYDILAQGEPSDPLGSTLDTLGMLYMGQGRCDEAITYFRRALELPDAIMNSAIRVIVLDNMATALCRLGRPAEAHVHLQEALRILERDNAPKADEVRARLEALA